MKKEGIKFFDFDVCLASEDSLAKDWMLPEENEAWNFLQNSSELIRPDKTGNAGRLSRVRPVSLL